MARVLVVEDEQGIAEALRRGLTGHGFAVDMALRGDDGLHKATVHDYDVILLDIMLPGLSGYEVLKRLRAADVWTPILMLTAKDGDYDIADALDLGADDYLAKPFGFVVLLARVRALQRRGGRERPAVLTVGDLILDPARRRCARAGTDVPLTTREFSVLECLLRRPGEVVSKTQILQQVWDEHYDGDSNIVEVYIGFLRRKIDVPFDRQSIVTVRGAGYRLDGGA
ncbi:MAG TPA: response regulator transcription factor [Blastococcus sp.]|jgi:DNA-binding response OmpR family regulator|nr:response regulator transcription factor [Blastococcus sp.]